MLQQNQTWVKQDLSKQGTTELKLNMYLVK